MAKGTFGERLKRERELREVSLEEITTATRIGPHFLEALENEEWSKLPGGVFNRGFVRSIARYLGLDEEAFLAEYDVAYNEQVPPRPETRENRIPSPPRWVPVVLGVALLVLLVALVIGGIYGLRYLAARRARRAAMAPTATALPYSEDRSSGSSTSSPSSTSGAQSPATPPLDLLVSPSAPTHLRIVADGNLLFDTIVHPGENRHFAANDEFEVTVADSGAVLLELNGQAMPPLGLPGSSGTIRLSGQDLRQASRGDSKPRSNR
jgi:cytoskeletal protein RodZ